LLFCLLFAAHIQQQAEDQQAHAETDADIRKIKHREIDEQAVQVNPPTSRYGYSQSGSQQRRPRPKSKQNATNAALSAKAEYTDKTRQHNTGYDHQKRKLDR
jgi:hypothetical protein